HAGDTWTHRFTVEMAMNGTTLMEKSGKVTTKLEEGQLDGKQVLIMTSTAETGISFLPTIRAARYMWQDAATGDIYELAESSSLSGGMKHVTPPVVIEPGRWSDKLNHGYKLTFEDGQSGEIKRQVIGLEKVKTA